jgi:hypothetical protein
LAGAVSQIASTIASAVAQVRIAGGASLDDAALHQMAAASLTPEKIDVIAASTGVEADTLRRLLSLVNAGASVSTSAAEAASREGTTRERASASLTAEAAAVGGDVQPNSRMAGAVIDPRAGESQSLLRIRSMLTEWAEKAERLYLEIDNDGKIDAMEEAKSFVPQFKQWFDDLASTDVDTWDLLYRSSTDDEKSRLRRSYRRLQNLLRDRFDEHIANLKDADERFASGFESVDAPAVVPGASDPKPASVETFNEDVLITGVAPAARALTPSYQWGASAVMGVASGVAFKAAVAADSLFGGLPLFTLGATALLATGHYLGMALTERRLNKDGVRETAFEADGTIFFDGSRIGAYLAHPELMLKPLMTHESTHAKGYGEAVAVLSQLRPFFAGLALTLWSGAVRAWSAVTGRVESSEAVTADTVTAALRAASSNDGASFQALAASAEGVESAGRAVVAWNWKTGRVELRLEPIPGAKATATRAVIPSSELNSEPGARVLPVHVHRDAVGTTVPRPSAADMVTGRTGIVLNADGTRWTVYDVVENAEGNPLVRLTSGAAGSSETTTTSLPFGAVMAESMAKAGDTLPLGEKEIGALAAGVLASLHENPEKVLDERRLTVEQINEMERLAKLQVGTGAPLALQVRGFLYRFEGPVPADAGMKRLFNAQIDQDVRRVLTSLGLAVGDLDATDADLATLAKREAAAARAASPAFHQMLGLRLKAALEPAMLESVARGEWPKGGELTVLKAVMDVLLAPALQSSMPGLSRGWMSVVHVEMRNGGIAETVVRNGHYTLRIPKGSLVSAVADTAHELAHVAVERSGLAERADKTMNRSAVEALAALWAIQSLPSSDASWKAVRSATWSRLAGLTASHRGSWAAVKLADRWIEDLNRESSTTLRSLRWNVLLARLAEGQELLAAMDAVLDGPTMIVVNGASVVEGAKVNEALLKSLDDALRATPELHLLLVDEGRGLSKKGRELVRLATARLSEQSRVRTIGRSSGVLDAQGRVDFGILKSKLPGFFGYKAEAMPNVKVRVLTTDRSAWRNLLDALVIVAPFRDLSNEVQNAIKAAIRVKTSA